MPEPATLIAPALALLAYALPETTPEAWATKSGFLAAALVAFAGWRVSRLGVRADRAVASALPWLALAAWTACSGGWSGHPVRTEFHAAVCAALALLAAAGTAASATALAGVLLIAAAWEVLPALVFGTPFRADSGRLTGTFVDADHFAACVAMAMGWVFVQTRAERRPGLPVWGALLLALAAAGSASASRAFLLAAGVIVAGGWWLEPVGATRRGWWTGAAAVGAGLVAAPALAARLADQAGGREAMAWARLDLWRIAAGMLRTAPLGGTGFGTFGEAFAASRPESFAALSTEYAHNEAIQLACETGLVGLGLAVWGGAVLARRGGFRGAEPGRSGLALAVAAVGVFALVDFPLHVPALALPAALALFGSGRSAGREERPVDRRMAIGIWSVSGAVALWLLSVGAADRCYAGGVRLALGGDAAGARERFTTALLASPEHAGAMAGLAELDPAGDGSPTLADRASALRPGWTDPVRTAFHLALRRHDRDGAWQALRRTERLDPVGLETRLMEVRWDEEEGDLASAAVRLAAVERVWPMHLDVWYARADLAVRQGRRGEARRLLRHILRIYPSAEYAAAWLGRLAP